MAGGQRPRDHLARFGDVETAGRFAQPPQRDIRQSGVVAKARFAKVRNANDWHGVQSDMVDSGGADLDAAARGSHRRAGSRCSAGAGVSTDSGIPDYRGPNSVPRTPMTFQAFLADAEARKRYWAGSHLGWQRFARAAPNAGHFALAELESAGVLSGILTQNVDALHERAGSARVVNLHGRLDRVRCLSCGQVYARDAISRQIVGTEPVAHRDRLRGAAPRRGRGCHGRPATSSSRRAGCAAAF